ncbi:MAG: hypothetical protein Ct9H300mP28_10640 [Pseudomonadota bacterium]|nr:MAG: hypothetical protein Ct9H300mP28_10640 [Pseudomonadota bacterium]
MKVMGLIMFPIIVEVMTDNRNRSIAFVRSSFRKYNGNLGQLILFNTCLIGSAQLLLRNLILMKTN